MIEKHICNNINVVDAIMGSGKSTYIINQINQNPGQKYLVVLPTLDEIERYKSAIQGVKMYDPKSKGKSKSVDLERLIANEKCILTTHELILRLKASTLELLQAMDYTLVIDECLSVIKEYDIKKADLRMLFNSNYVFVDEAGYLCWNKDHDEANQYNGKKFAVERELCNLQALMAYNDKQGNTYKLMWVFPVDFFGCFNESFILTYGWEGSFNKSYFDMYNIEYKHLSLYHEELIEYNINYELTVRQKYKDLINICRDEKLNAIGKPSLKVRNPLCMNWYKNHKHDNDIFMTILKNNTRNYFLNIINAGSRCNMWTTFLDYKPKISAKGYAGRGKNDCFVSLGTKATNEYSHKTTLAFLVNTFSKPDYQDFLRCFGVEFNVTRFALNEMLQWIWRSAIRNGEPINIYIPSERMRNLLDKWLTGEI